MPDYLTVLDLFSGPGGLSEGINNARNHHFRFKVVVANDFDTSVEATYKLNHSDTEFVLGDIREEAIKRRIREAIKQKTRRKTVDVVIGGPPCKGFSIENKMTRHMKNPMNHLVMQFVDMIRRLEPAAFVMENVPGIWAMQRGKVVKTLLSEFKSLGYHNADAWLLNAADYGVPQLRKRAFLIGSKSRIPIEKPKKTHGTNSEIKENPKLLPYVKLVETIGDLPRISVGKSHASTDEYTQPPENYYQEEMRRRSTKVTNHVVTINSPQVIKRIKTVPPGGNWENIPVRLMKVNGKYSKIEMVHSMIYKRLLKNEPSITITNFRKGMIIHPTQDRILSVREAARVQSFPDDFLFEGGLSKQQQQVSDAVPAKLAKKVGDVILIHLHDVIRLVTH